LPPNGWAGQTSSTASGKSSHSAYSNTIFQMPNNTETSKNSTRQLTLDELISSQEDSPVNLTHSPESERERMTNATCGRRCCALFESVHPVGSWARTFAGLLVGMEGWSSRRCALTWKLKGTPFNRSYFLLQVSAHHTEEIASGLLLTPTTREEIMDMDKFAQRMQKYDNGTTVPNLATQVLTMLPTPTAHQQKTQFQQGGICLHAHLIKNKMCGKNSQLSAQFVGEMMGFPKDWTASPFQSGEGKA